MPPSTTPSPLPPETTTAIAPLLATIHQMAQADALALAGLPHVWQEVARALDCTDLSWYRDWNPLSARWRPGLRAGVTLQMAKDNLVALSPRPATKAASYLLTHFSGASLLELRSQVLGYYRSLQARKFRDWWREVPVCAESSRGVNEFALKASTLFGGTNTFSLAAKVVSHLHPTLNEVLDNFFSSEKPRSDSESTAHELFFTLRGSLAWSPALKNPVRERFRPLVAHLVTAVPIEDQRDPAKVTAYLLNTLEGQLLHQAQHVLGSMEVSLIGDMAMAGFPLLYWRDLSQSAAPAPALPQGRRSEFTQAEAAAIYQALHDKVANAMDVLNDPQRSLKKNGPAAVRKATASITGRLGFEHISALRLFSWVDACEKLLERPDVCQHAWGRPIDELRAECARFVQLRNTTRDLFYLLLVKNHGLAETLATSFIRQNETFRNVHDSRNLHSFVRTEMIESLASFNYLTGRRFSTYAVNRVKYELRRSPLQERQLVRLSSDQTTAQARIWQLAMESELDEKDPEYYRDLAQRYNKAFSSSGRATLSPHQVQDLLRVGHVVYVGPSEGEGDEEHSPVPLVAPAAEPPTAEELAEVTACVREMLGKFTPAEELTLSVLLRASPSEHARGRFNRGALEDAKQRMGQVIDSRRVSVIGGNGSRSSSGAPMVLLTRGHLREVAIRTKQGDELARNERRGANVQK